MSYRIFGTVAEKETHRGVAGLIVKAFDQDADHDDFLGQSNTDGYGKFEIQYEEEAFKDHFAEEKPDIYLIVLNSKGVIIYTTDKAVRFQSGHSEQFDLKVPRNLINKPNPLNEDEFIHSFKRDPKLIKVKTKLIK